jgi:predicted GNAT family N-acyltransferase
MSETGFRLERVRWQDAEADIRAVRDAVFVKEQGIAPEHEWDGSDNNYTHVLAKDLQGNPVGTGRIDSQGHIGRMAVVARWRHHGVATGLLQLLKTIACEQGLNEVWLSAQTPVVEFYRKRGFEPVGEVYREAGIAHQKMVCRQLT